MYSGKNATRHGKMGLSLAEMLEYQTGVADILNVVGNIYRDQDNYEKVRANPRNKIRL